MAKSRSISSFQQALKNNTRYISSQDAENEPLDNQTPMVGELAVDQTLVSRIQDLAARHGIDPNRLIEVALEYFLSLEDEWFAPESAAKE